MPEPVRVHVGPRSDAAMAAALRGAGAEPVGDPAGADALVWNVWDDVDGLRSALHPGIRWVQLTTAGVDHLLRAGVLDRERVWTTASSAYAHAVAEHALTLILATRRRLPEAARATRWSGELGGATLRGATVMIIGAGSIGGALISLLAPFGADVIAINRSGRAVEGARRTLPTERRHDVWDCADVVVVAAPATAETSHLIDAAALSAMRPGAWLVNVSRGSLVDTDALVAALAAGSIGGAALDVTDPEPLPDDHPLWSQPRALITPHTATPQAVVVQELAALAAENATRLREGRELVGVLDVDRGY